LSAKSIEKEKNMPVMIPVNVQVPPAYTLRVDELQAQLTEYAQALIDTDANAMHRVYSAAELASHTCSPEELRDNLLQHVHSHFHPEI